MDAILIKLYNMKRSDLIFYKGDVLIRFKREESKRKMRVLDF